MNATTSEDIKAIAQTDEYKNLVAEKNRNYKRKFRNWEYVHRFYFYGATFCFPSFL